MQVTLPSFVAFKKFRTELAAYKFYTTMLSSLLQQLEMI